MLPVALLSCALLQSFGQYMPMPIYVPMQVNTLGNTERLVRDQLPKDSSRSYGVLAKGSADTIALALPRLEVDTTVQYREQRGGATNLPELEAWGKAVLDVFATELLTKLKRSSVVERVDTVPPGPDGLGDPPRITSSRPVLVVQSLRVHPVFIGTMPTKGDWGMNAVATWGVWDPASGKWIRKGSKSLRTKTSQTRIHTSTETGKMMAEAVVANFGMRGVTGRVDVLQRRQAFGGIHVLGDLGLHGAGAGDTKDFMDENLEADGRPSITGSTIGVKLLYIPDWYGFGAGFDRGRVDVNVQKSSATAFEREEYYGIATACYPVRSLSPADGSTNVHADLSVGWASYATDELFRVDETMGGWLFRPEVGLNYTGSLFVVGSTLGYEWLNLSNDDLEWNDRFFRFGVQLGFRMFTGAGR